LFCINTFETLENSFISFTASTTDGARGWILWVALAVMMAESFISLVPVAADLFRSLRRRPKSPSLTTLGQQEFGDEDEDPETPDRLVPLKWITWGAGASISIGTILVWIVFGHEGIKPWATVIGFFLGALLSLLGYFDSLL
jgi:OPT oligopeptide transporter protein